MSFIKKGQNSGHGEMMWLFAKIISVKLGFSWFTLEISSIKTEFKKNMVKRNKGHYVMIKGSVHQEDIAIVNIYESYIIVHI